MFVKPQSYHAIELNKKLQQLAITLRNQSTPAERLLWKQLQSKQLNHYKFRRQYVLYQYIVDFYCHTARLIIEVGGGIHDTKKDRDAFRDKVLTAAGYQVLRFTNQQVQYELDSVILEIKNCLK
ncbi:MAG: endonuclease domain-containing protein [Patescibacteria group bacterium]|jgi:very-short-patch-repair endonuclease